MGTININNLQNPISIADLQSPATNGVDEVKENKVTAPETEQISNETTSVQQDVEKVLISGGSQIEQKGQVFASSHKITAARKPDDSWVMVDKNELALKFDDLYKLTHGKYNLGQLKLDANGKLDIINNHKFRILRNFSKTTPAENRAVREAVADALKTRFRNLAKSLTPTNAQKFTRLINSLTAAGDCEKALSRNEVGSLIDQFRNFETGNDDYKSTFEKLKMFMEAVPELKDKPIDFSLSGEILIGNRLPSEGENRILRTALVDWLKQSYMTKTSGSDPKQSPVLIAAKAFLLGAKDISHAVKFDDVVALSKMIGKCWPEKSDIRIADEYVQGQQKLWDKAIGKFVSGFSSDTLIMKGINTGKDLHLAKEIILKGKEALKQGVKEIADQEDNVNKLNGEAEFVLARIKLFHSTLPQMPANDQQELLSLLHSTKDVENDNTPKGKEAIEKIKDQIGKITGKVSEDFSKAVNNIFFNNLRCDRKVSERLAVVESLKHDFAQISSNLDHGKVTADDSYVDSCRLKEQKKLVKEFLADHPSELDELKTGDLPSIMSRLQELKDKIDGYEKDLANEVSWKELTNHDIEVLRSKIKAMETNPQNEVQAGGGAKKTIVLARDHEQDRHDINDAIDFLDGLGSSQDLSALEYEGENTFIKDIVERLQTGYREEDDNGDEDDESTIAALKNGLRLQLENTEDVLAGKPVVNAPKQATEKTLDDLRRELAEKEKLVELQKMTITRLQHSMDEYALLEVQRDYLTMFRENEVN